LFSHVRKEKMKFLAPTGNIFSPTSRKIHYCPPKEIILPTPMSLAAMAVLGQRLLTLLIKQGFKLQL